MVKCGVCYKELAPSDYWLKVCARCEVDRQDLNSMLEDVALSGVESALPRYVVVQIDRGLWDELQRWSAKRKGG